MATNQQRREAAKRKLERQLVRRAERAKRRKIIGVGVTVGAVVVIAGVVVFFATRSGEDAAAAPTNTPEPPPVQIPTQRAEEPKRPEAVANPTTCEYPAKPDEPAAKPVNTPPAGPTPATGTVNVTIKSTAGDIPMTLNRALAPCTVNNFISLAQQGFYTDTECHRLGTEGLQMLQCGDPQGTGSGGPGYSFNDEVFPELKYGRGLLAMANAGPNTNGSQFFMVYGDAQLEPNYTVFGSISDAGLQVLDKVARDGVDPAAAAGSQDGTGKPKTPVKFTAVTVDA
ncbi:peptidylprolyl isomerase [Amycolatopsis nigrescens]|uniref:peptidylprolyl isomerase n=1 Tax=Amycolatopsis nigrescens TaxID=381445 RepID=UPI00037D6AC8|nr:peptidylprolyl isomerase [Amycolatopsis nigrescens]